jgi:hypothetical protein
VTQTYEVIMKVQDLFEATRVATDKGYYTPGYDEEEKNIRGTVKDWMARLGATKEDIAAAVAQAKDLDSYAKLVSFDKSTGTEQKNGTFSFKKPGAGHRDEKYMVYANGQIRSSSLNSMDGEHRPTRLKAPKPRLVAGDAIKSLVKIYDGAFKELASKMSKRVVKESDDVVQQVFDRLDMTHPTDDDKKFMAQDIARKTKDGWTVSEIASYMRSMEEVNPELDEDTALARMKKVKDAVAARLKAA